MGIEFLTCDHCGKGFPDCNDYVICEGDDCYRKWCSDECANEDDHQIECCSLYCKIYDGTCEDEECPKGKNGESCIGCDNYNLASCNYCRGEDFPDSKLLDVAMNLSKCDRQFLINQAKK